jgi:large conductance mechanosensitive channel
MSMIEDFKKFAMKGNVIDLAVAVVIGAAFGRIVTSFVNDIIMPPIGILIGGVDFSELSVVLQEAVGETAAVTINYGVFIQTVINFLIIAFTIFLVIRAYENTKQKEEEKPAPVAVIPPQEKLLAEIRDLLKSKES